ncbi:ESX secretion-associated protein EspG [Amycolatopsis thermalba]|uniref:ESX secretion-associated protein EspG n=1 Tax=Amycolatopsis thermalba TaxID=944492 RepID=A0ABY4NRK5_9PSEU|nr:MULTISPECIES: ESX secretion-associated protein EspG [Amycolatopsis]UQS22682.1 ESX secretion-associated protein EspG [Amycolatopsis thermalba]
MLTFEAAPAELDILDEELGLGRFVYPHKVPFVSGTRTERAEQRRRVFEHWHRLGRMSRDRLQPEFEDLLRLWARPEVLVTQVVAELTTDAQILARGGWAGQHGVLSRQTGDDVTFHELRAGQVLPQLLDPLPEVPPVRIAPVNYVSQPRGGDLFGGGEPPREKRVADRYFAAPPLRAGVVSCSVRGVDAGRLTWFDTPDGRFFTTVEHLPDGAQRHTFTPADRARIGQWVRDRVNQHLTAVHR